jgi:UDP-4-amino-4,6-dideoxy-N-acetyl-beta-L-altrosamine transaminase
MMQNSEHSQFLPYGRHFIEDDDIAAVVKVLGSDYLTTGPATEAFEAALAETTGARHAVSCSSGTTALHLSMLALGLGYGDAVIVPSVTFLATANAARYVGADVVFADVDPETGLMRPKDLTDAIERAQGRAKAVVSVYLAGQCPDVPAIAALAKEHQLMVVEDACHALGSSYGHTVGSCADADMSTFSFHPVKVIAMGEGGAVTTNNEDLAARLRLFRSHGMVRDADAFVNGDLSLDSSGAANPWSYEMAEVGFNYRASELHCALGLSQLCKLDRFVEKRRALVDNYDVLLEPLASIARPISRTPGEPAWHLYVALIDFEKAGTTRAQVMRALKDRGIGTQVHYIPVHAQPYYRRLYGEQNLPGVMAYYTRCLSLPLHVAMTESDVERVVHELVSVLA